MCQAYNVKLVVREHTRHNLVRLRVTLAQQVKPHSPREHLHRHCANAVLDSQGSLEVKNVDLAPQEASRQELDTWRAHLVLATRRQQQQEHRLQLNASAMQATPAAMDQRVHRVRRIPTRMLSAQERVKVVQLAETCLVEGKRDVAAKKATAGKEGACKRVCRVRLDFTRTL